jgi:hypothetical protein
MENNPYAPPLSEVKDTPFNAQPTGSPVFFPVGIPKFLVLSFCTLGLYQLYWFYKNWMAVKERTGESIIPFGRAFFGIFYCYALLKRVRAHDDQLPSANLAAGPLATAWIVLNICGQLPDPFWLLALGTFIPLVPVIQAIKVINEAHAPGHDPNTQFSVANWVGVGAGVLLWVLIAIGLTMGVETD